MIWDEAASATIIKTGAAQRSNRGALLKKIHQTPTANPQNSPPNKPIPIASGTKTGITNLTSHCSITMTTPGHNRSGFFGVGPMAFLLLFIILAFCLWIIFIYDFAILFYT
jgi:hypothetical protein